jgi:hypothetical protein
MSTKAGEREASPGEETAAEEAGAPATLEELVAREDVDGLLALAKAHRGGTDGVTKDLKQCLACYAAAAKLGSAEAEYGAALFYLSGGVVAQDLKEGATRLRTAADGGFLPAKVYLANLYELGVHYAADTAKADVWYRNAARGAGIDADPAGDEYARAMADLGCVRYALALAEDPSASAEDRERFLKKAKAYGYQLKIRRDRASMAAAEPAAVDAAAATTETVREASPKKAAKAAPEPKDAEPKKRAAARAPSASVLGSLAAFAYETMFVAASIAAGYLAHLGALELVHHGTAIPLLGHRLYLIIPILLAVIGVLPAFLMYKAGTVVRALAIAAIAGGAGYAVWEAGRALLFATREIQTLAFGVAGFLATLLVLGLFGGVKPPRRPPPRILS